MLTRDGVPAAHHFIFTGGDYERFAVKVDRAEHSCGSAHLNGSSNRLAGECVPPVQRAVGVARRYQQPVSWRAQQSHVGDFSEATALERRSQHPSAFRIPANHVPVVPARGDQCSAVRQAVRSNARDDGIVALQRRNWASSGIQSPAVHPLVVSRPYQHCSPTRQIGGSHRPHGSSVRAPPRQGFAVRCLPAIDSSLARRRDQCPRSGPPHRSKRIHTLQCRSRTPKQRTRLGVPSGQPVTPILRRDQDEAPARSGRVALQQNWPGYPVMSTRNAHTLPISRL